MSAFSRKSTPAAAAANATSASRPASDKSVGSLSSVRSRSNQLRNKDKGVLEALEDALAKFNLRPRHFAGKEWARIPAIWRGSMDFNISVNLETGVATDFASAPEDQTRNSKFLTHSFNELMKLLDHTPGDIKFAKPDSTGNQNASMQRTKDAARMFREGLNLKQKGVAVDICRQYLLSRGIPESVIDRYAESMRAVKNEYGAVLALPIMQPKVNGSMNAIQRIFLTPDAQKYGDEPKKMLGSHFYGNKACGYLLNGDSSRFNKREVALVEGWETGMAVHAATGMPVYVLYDSNGLRAVNELYLSEIGVQSVLIAADNDDPDKYGRRAGQESALQVANWMTKDLNIPVRIALPPRSYTDGAKCDWLDIWNADPAGAARLIYGAQIYTADTDIEKPVVRSGLRGAFGGAR